MKSTQDTQNAFSIIRQSLIDIGYPDDLLVEDYPFVYATAMDYDVRRIPLAAFGRKPTSYRSACIGVVLSMTDDLSEIANFTALGAPMLFSIHPNMNEVRRWRIVAKGNPRLLERIEFDNIREAFRQNRDAWGPDEIIRAKSISFSRRHLQLDFFDAGLIPVIDELVFEKLDRLLRDVLASSTVIFQEYNDRKMSEEEYKGLFRLVFRLIAAKLLNDRAFPGRWGDSDVNVVLDAVQEYYFQTSSSGIVLGDDMVRQNAWRRIRASLHLPNISLETLAAVYESTFVVDETRKSLGIHATPYSISDYVLQRLPIDELAEDDRRIFEPFSGHAPFLVSGLRRLRELLPVTVDEDVRHDYFVRMLAGMEVDAFACEIARYSLIIADYPNPNGWRIINDNVYTSPLIAPLLDQSNIVLCNPPYGAFGTRKQKRPTSLVAPDKDVEALRRVVQRKPMMLGFVLPKVFLDGQSYRDLRFEISASYSNVELVSLPENVFRYSDAETVILIAHGRREDKALHYSAIVNKQDYGQFALTGIPSWQKEVLVEEENNSLWHGPLAEHWEYLSSLPKLGDFVMVSRGIEYKLKLRENANLLISNHPKEGFQRGIVRVADGFEPYRLIASQYLNMDPSLMI